MSKVKKDAQTNGKFSSSSSSSSLSTDEEVDSWDLKSIREYLSDKRELASQLFKSVKPEKIRMMLPQVLKKVDLGELQELCASELSGMSKTRILSILDGKSMAESSDTSDSDNSGPSLEIISDTEEWLTDEDAPKMENGSAKKIIKREKKTKRRSQKKNGLDKKNIEHKDVTVKKEEDKENKDTKDGDSLLDLLELEMRARAIRALIRKEEDIIPNTEESKNSTNSNTKENAKTMQDEQKEKDKCRQQFEQIISSKEGTAGDDEDVVVVVQPTPTIELLSSDGEGDENNGVRLNQKLENERAVEAEKTVNGLETENEKNTNNAESNQKSEETEQHELSKENDATSKKSADDNNSQLPSTSHGSSKPRRKRKLRSKNRSSSSSQSKESSKLKLTDTQGTSDEKVASSEQDSACTSETIKTEKDTDTVKNSNEETKEIPEDKLTSEGDKTVDMEEIIDLDAYCEDMEEMCDNNTSEKKSKVENEQSDSTEKSLPQKSGETWATRYFQTDDVQNVIKESKIQSEIRKRLRERQRLSKLSKSPNLNVTSTTSSAETTPEQDPTGSVQEYLALKRNTPIDASSGSNNEESTLETEVQNTDSQSENAVNMDTEFTESINTASAMAVEETQSCTGNTTESS